MVRATIKSSAHNEKSTVRARFDCEENAYITAKKQGDGNDTDYPVQEALNLLECSLEIILLFGQYQYVLAWSSTNWLQLTLYRSICL